VRVQPDEKPAPEPLHRLSNGLFDVNAFQTDVAALLKMLAQETGIGIIVGSSVNGKVTFDLKQASMERVLDYATKSAGLLYRREGSAYFVGTEKDIAAAYPAPKTEPPAVKIPVMQQAIYRCRYISATNLVTTLEKMFDKEQLRVSLGVSPISPRLSGGNNTGGGSASSSGGSSGSAGGGGSQPSGTSSGSGSGASVGSSGIEAREVILYGDAPQVERAMQMAQQLDVRRKQVRIVVRITDISNNALRELGLQYNYSSFSISERTPSAAGSTPAGTTAAAPSGIDFGSFTRSPFSISATLSALEKNDRAKLLAAPTLSLLDGEQGYILIGDRLVYPKLIGYTQAQTPIFDKAEERVGIYLQLAALLSDDGEITLTIYPQVSVVTGYLTVNGASYPQISTREQQTTVRVKDRQEIVVGGLIRNEELFNQQSVPILSRIPLFGELFRYRKRTKNQSELIVTITPEILKD
jgi:type II secretory pathway component GspD/PulD (secretin)